MKTIKNFFRKLSEKCNKVAINAKTAVANVQAEGYIDTGVKIIIALFNTTIIPTLGTKISEMFNYAG